MKLNKLFYTPPGKLPKTPSQEEQACCRASQLIGKVSAFMELEDIEQEFLAVLKQRAARDKAEERVRLNKFTARILRPKAKPMVTKPHCAKGDRGWQVELKPKALNRPSLQDILDQLLHTPVGVLLGRPYQDLRGMREQLLLGVRWINGVIAMKTQEEARL